MNGFEIQKMAHNLGLFYHTNQDATKNLKKEDQQWISTKQQDKHI